MNTKLQIAIASILSGSVLVSCGEATVGSPTPATLAVVKTTPQNFTSGAPIDAPITIEFADALNPTTVTSANIMLMPGTSGMEDMASMPGMDDMANMDHSTMDMADMSVIPGNVICDPTSPDCKKIVFTPSMSLAWGQKYHVMVHNLKTASGKVFSGEHVVPVEFTTAYVVETKSERDINDISKKRTTITDYTPGNDAPPIRTKRTDTRMRNGVQETVITLYNQQVGQRTGDVRLKAGQNIAFISDPATQIDRYTYRLMEGGKMAATVVFSGPGTDNVWGTSDDLVSSYTVRRAEHMTHQLTSTFGLPRDSAIQGVEVNPLSLATLNAKAAFVSRGATLNFLESTPSSAMRLKKTIRFTSLGANKTADIDASGSKTAGSDDNIDSYRVYQYNAQHGARSSRSEYDDTGGNLTLNEQLDAQFLSGYRVYRTAQNQQIFGNAVGMLRTAEIVYSKGGGTDGDLLTEDNNTVRDFELSFFCPTGTDLTTQKPNGLYEKYVVEIAPVGGTFGSILNSQFPGSTIENSLVSQNNCSIEPSQSAVQQVGLTGTIQDISTNTKFF